MIRNQLTTLLKLMITINTIFIFSEYFQSINNYCLEIVIFSDDVVKTKQPLIYACNDFVLLPGPEPFLTTGSKFPTVPSFSTAVGPNVTWSDTSPWAPSFGFIWTASCFESEKKMSVRNVLTYLPVLAEGYSIYELSVELTEFWWHNWISSCNKASRTEIKKAYRCIVQCN